MAAGPDLPDAVVREATAALTGRAPAPPRRSRPPSLRALLRRRPRTLLVDIARWAVVRGLSWYVDARIADFAQQHLHPAGASELSRLDEHVRRVDANEVNIELIKSDLHAINRNLEKLSAGVDAMAKAIAPAAGLPGVPGRFAELRERVNVIERRTRSAAPSPPVGAATADPPVDLRSSPLDYVALERRFRGDPAVIQGLIAERYLETLRGRGPVLDIGCGKGELLQLLRSNDIEAVGVDVDPGMHSQARAAGLAVHLGDMNEFLEAQPPASFGAIIAVQVVEHLELEQLVRCLELSASRLRPGGVFIAETPNPASLIVLGNSYLLDPTHVRPLHPSLLVFLCECAGFASVEQRFFSLPDNGLRSIDDPAAPEWSGAINEAFRRLNEVIFGPQDYAVIAEAPAHPL